MVKSISKTVALSALALLLALTLIVSSFTAFGATFDVSSLGYNEFNQQYLYIDLTDSGKSLKGVNYYWDYDCTNEGGWMADYTKVSEKFYCFDLKTYHSSYKYFRGFKLVFTDDSTYKIGVIDGSTDNCVYVMPNNSCQWSKYIEKNLGGTTYQKNAHSEVNNLTGNEIVLMNSTFYDYYMDEEINGEWRKSLSGNYRTVERDGGDNNDANRAARQPYERFNRALADYAKANGWSIPLYFGNFYGKSDGYTGRGVSNLYNFKAIPNDSNNLSDPYTSVTGLVDSSLNTNNSLQSNGVTVPFFDSNWLVNNGYGTVINSPFPMRVTKTSKDNPYYKFSSINGRDNIFFSDRDSDSPYMNYGFESEYGVYDSLSGYSAEENGIGFFPFDKRSDHDKNGYDYGFGMKLEIPFTLADFGHVGTGDSKEDTIFEFSGDDDLWVYVDGKLLLDMGGDHKKSSGCIDFATMKSYVNSVDRTYSSSSDPLYYHTGTNTINGRTYRYYADFPSLFGESGTEAFDNNNPNVRHTLTLFYVERGMIESNLEVGFNFVPVSNSLTVDETVNVDNINDKLKDAVKDADIFEFTVKEATTKSGTYSDTNPEYTLNDSTKEGVISTVHKDTHGIFDLGNIDNALFNRQFTVSDYLKIDQTVSSTQTKPSSGLVYDTSWKLKDLGTGNTITNGSAPLSNFKFINESGDEIISTNLQLSYVNTPQVANIKVSKTVVDESGNVIPSGDLPPDLKFDIEALFDFNKDNVYESYGMTAQISPSAPFTFTDIPVGVSYKIVEADKEGYTNLENGKYTSVLTSSGADITVKNRKDDISAKATIDVKKTLEDKSYYGTAFSFTAQGIPSIVIDGKATKDTSSMTPETVNTIDQSSAGNVVFSKISLTEEGTYVYRIDENSTTLTTAPDSDYQYDNETVLAVVNVVKKDGKLSAATNYYKGKLNGSTVTDYQNLIKEGVQDFTFVNTVTDGSVTINKSDDIDGKHKIKDVEFTIYKTTADGAKTGTPVAKAKTDKDGVVKFENLDIFVGQDIEAETITDFAKDYQWYYVAETGCPEGYVVNSTKYYFKLPTNGSYDITYSYVDAPIIIPATAGIPNPVFWVVGLGLCVTAFVFVIKRYRKPCRHTCRHAR